MDPTPRDGATARFDRALELVGAIARGDAYLEDISAQLRDEGFDALDVMLAALAGAARQATDPRDKARPIDVSTFSRPSDPALVARTVHQAPAIPFMLNGVLHDPKDISRFDGQELHLFSLRGDLLAFDNRESIARIWELLYIAPMSDTALNALANSPDLSATGPPAPFWPDIDEDEIGAHFWEHAAHGGWGDHLFCPKNRGYWDLTEVCKGFLCSDDWNDKISSFRCWSTPFVNNNVCVLHEHVHWTGSTFSSVGTGRECFAFRELDSVGWNDRASSVETW